MSAKQFIDPESSPSVKRKSDSIRLAYLGFFGNNLLMWLDIPTLKASGFKDLVAIRYKSKQSPFCRYNVPIDQVDATIAEFTKLGADPSLFFANEMSRADCSDRTLKGEVARSPNYYDLHYSY